MNVNSSSDPWCCRALKQLFQQVETREERGDQVVVTIGFLEIYQEEVFDLLSPGKFHILSGDEKFFKNPSR